MVRVAQATGGYTANRFCVRSRNQVVNQKPKLCQQQQQQQRTHTYTQCKGMTKQPRERREKSGRRAGEVGGANEPNWPNSHQAVSSYGSCCVSELRPPPRPPPRPRHVDEVDGVGVGVAVGSLLMALGDCLAASSLRQLGHSQR